MKRQLDVRFLVIFLVITGLTGGLAYFAHARQIARHADYLFKRGLLEQEKGDIDSAMDYYLKYLAFRPDDGAARGKFGLLLADKATSPKQKERAFLTLEHALRDDPGLSEARRKAVDLAIELSRFADAKLSLEILLQGKPGDPELMSQLGRCEEEAGRTNEAVAQYEAVIARSPGRIESYQRLAALYRKANQQDKADGVMAKIVANNPDSIRAKLLRFQYFRSAGNLDAARRDLADAQKATDLQDSEADLLLASADLATVDKNYDDARAHFNRGRKLPKQDLRFALGLANMEMRLGNRAEAAKVLREAKTVTAADPAETWAIADLFIDVNEPGEADQLVAGLSKAITPAAVDFLIARLKMSKGELSSALGMLDRCRREFVRSPDLALRTELLLANCYERLGQVDQREAHCRNALQLDPGSVPARTVLAAALLAGGKIDEAIGEYQSMRGRVDDVRLTIARIRIWQSQVRPADRVPLLSAAAAELEGAQDALKKTPDYQMAMVELAVARGQRAEARKALEAALDKYPEEVRFWLARAALAAADGKPVDGLAVLAAAEAKLGNKVELKLSRIGFLLRDGADATAFRQLEAGVEGLPESDRDRLMLALSEAYARTNAAADAERLLRTLVGYHPNDPALLSRLLDAVVPKGNPDEVGGLADKLRRSEGEEGVVWRFADAYRNWLQYRKDNNPASLLTAQSRLEEAGKRRPGWFRVPLLQAEIEDNGGHVESAIEKYKAAIRLGARHPEVVRRAVQLLVARRRLDEAREQLNAVRSQSAALPQELGKTAVELALLGGEKPDQAFELAEKAVSKDSRDYKDHLWRGQVLWSMDRKKDAEEAFRRAVALDPAAPEAWVSFVVFLARTDRAEDAKKELDKAGQSLPPDKRARALAPCHEAVGNRAEAEKQYAALAAEAPNDLGVLRSQAAFHLGGGEAAKAEPILRRLIDASPNGSDTRRWARRSLSLAWVGTGEYGRATDALGLLEANLREKPGSPEDLRTRALVQALRPGGRQQSIKDLEDSFARLLPTPTEEFMLARLYELDGNWLKAQERFEGLLTRKGGANPAFFAHYIRALLKRDDASGAAVWLARMIADAVRGDKSPVAVELKARLLAKQGKGADAADLLKGFARTAYQEKKNPNTLRDVGRLLAELKLSRDAEEMLREYVNVAEMKTPDAILVLAEFLARDNRVGESLRLCDKAMKAAGPEFTALVAVSAVRLGDAAPAHYAEAEAVVNEALRRLPQSLDLQTSLAELRDAQGRYDEARERYRAILARDGRNQIALNNLAWLLALRGENPDEALRLIDQAIQTAGPEANLLDTRGVVLLALKRTDEAIAALGEAIAQSRSAEAYYHLALAHHRAGHALEAQRAMRQAKEAGFTLKNLHPLEAKGYEEFAKAIGGV